jgi:hypothetical protein
MFEMQGRQGLPPTFSFQSHQCPDNGKKAQPKSLSHAFLSHGLEGLEQASRRQSLAESALEAVQVSVSSQVQFSFVMLGDVGDFS